MTDAPTGTIGGLAGALARVQANLPTIEKSKTATVTMKAGGTYSYKYADLADAVEKTYPLLAEHGLSFLPHRRSTHRAASYLPMRSCMKVARNDPANTHSSRLFACTTSLLLRQLHAGQR
jgi:hypothetical protein